MRVNSQGSQFVFNLPSDLVPPSLIERYTPILEKNWIQYENVIDYINSTIKEVSFPGISLVLPEQTFMRGKKIAHKPATNANDITSTRELVIQFRSVDSDLNYLLLYDLMYNLYLDVRNVHDKPIQITALDIHRDAIYTINFKQTIFSNLSELIFAYNQQSFNEKTFSMTFHYNFIDIEFILNGDKILELRQDELPVIKERNFRTGEGL